MITKSMTGYGKGASEIACQKLVVELKAVNHRFLDLNIKLPKGFTFAEDVIRKIIKDKVERGHIDVYVNYEDKRADKVSISVDYDLAGAYMSAADKLATTLGKSSNFGVAEVLRMPEVVSQSVNDVDDEVLNNLVVEATLQALERLDLMRVREGQLM
ncbi:MAG: YicC/YloC family endoribonuclease, partial [Clostridia bacterium]